MNHILVILLIFIGLVGFATACENCTINQSINYNPYGILIGKYIVLHNGEKLSGTILDTVGDFIKTSNSADSYLNLGLFGRFKLYENESMVEPSPEMFK